ncbi:hypothetical protein [Actinomyces polynesiensis]|uniref:hypothetical protein n=1 Tax=Actinomyces polynesiensis TaxID=1325934 RepID=UPI0005BE10AB|nr:hypothetical protein [Actinomyces polynesiensis]
MVRPRILDLGAVAVLEQTLPTQVFARPDTAELRARSLSSVAPADATILQGVPSREDSEAVPGTR